MLIVATIAAAAVSAVRPGVARAAHQPRVVIVVGPVGRNTGSFIRSARTLARAARSYGARVTEIYSPNATWARVRVASRGANVLIYLGHGNGWPSPYAPFQTRTKDGLGLNSRPGRGHSNVRHYGEREVAARIRLARNAAVLLHRLCYATGNSEMGHRDPTRSVARKRVDNYAAGFLRTGARVVFGEGHTSPRYVLHGLLRTNRTMRQIFWSAPSATRRYVTSFSSQRTRWADVVMDPYRPGRYYRSVVGDLDMRASEWRGRSATARDAADDVRASNGSAAPSEATTRITRARTPVRAGPSTDHATRATLPGATAVLVIGSTVNHYGNRWYRVRLSSGAIGWVSGRLTRPAG